MSNTATGKKVRLPKPATDRKRPNKAFIEQTARVRGYMTGNEKTTLITLKVKNAMQRVNNRTMSDNVNDTFSGVQNDALQKLMKEFVKNIDAVIKNN